MLVFTLDEVNEMTRGKGVILQRFKDGDLADARVFKKADGLTWLDQRRAHLHAVMGGAEGLGRRARAGRPPRAQGLPALQQVRPGVLGKGLPRSGRRISGALQLREVRLEGSLTEQGARLNDEVYALR